MGGGFNYNGEGATGTGLDRDPYVRDSNGNAIGVKSGYHAESYGTSSPALGPNGAIQITAGVIAVPGDKPRPDGGSGGGNTVNTGPAGQLLVMNKGQLGYWETRSTGAGNNEHNTSVFVAVGPSEAEKTASAEKALKEKQQAEAAAKDFAAKTAAASATAEKERQQAIAAATAAGQHQSVSDARNSLNNATSDVSRLKSAADSALQEAKAKRKAAIDAVPVATQAENKYQELQQKIKGLKLKNGEYGTEKWEIIGSNKEHDHWGYRFYPSGITKAQVDAAQSDAVNKRNQATSLASQATAAEQDSLKATAAYNAAETRRQAAQAALNSAEQAAAAERKRQEAEAAAAAAAEKKRQADAAAKAAEEARAAAEKAKLMQERQAAADKLKSTDIQSVRGIPSTASPAASPISWAVASLGGISLDSVTAGKAWTQIAEVMAKLRGIAGASLVGPVVATAVGLFWSRDVGIGSDVVPGRDISGLMPGDALSLPDLATLIKAADSKTGVSMPVRGRIIVREGDYLESQFVRTPVAGSVPVVRATLDKATGYWGYTLPAIQGVPGQTILVSPSDAPGVNAPLGLAGPVPLPETIIHTGGQTTVPQGGTVTVSPVIGEVDFRDLILVFPPESGLKPLYVMPVSPYGDATEKGEHSGRPYNPDKAGGPVQNLNWRSAVINKAGIDKVKLHTGRFGESAANKVMIDRLEKILSGQLQVTDTDKRFYTHELRELERYRALGVPDNVKPDDKGVTWNNTHTATLEDYKINEKTDPLYTKDAEEAEYKAELKNK